MQYLLFLGHGVGPMGCTPGQSIGPQVPDGGSQVTLSPCASGPCLNGATCIPLATSFMCSCPVGYTGYMCQNQIDNCANNPCLNGGTCTNQVGSYTCQCSSEYTGDRCQDEVEVCGGSYSGNSGEIDYPLGITNNYAHNQSCSYTIEVAHNQVINVTFLEFHLESSTNCVHDWLQIHDGSDTPARTIGRFCGTNLPSSFVSTTHQLYMWMRTDYSVAHPGFRLVYHATPPSCGFDMEAPAEHGSIQSPGFPGNYPHHRDCVWTLRAPPGKRIQFLFATLSLETHPNCSYDYLEIYNGDAINNADHNLLQRFCSSVTPPPVTSSGPIATVHFHSDESLSDTGFSIAWAAVPGIPGCGGLLTAATGQFSSPRHPETYEHNLDCQWLIRVPRGDRIELNFLSFDLERHSNCV